MKKYAALLVLVAFSFCATAQEPQKVEKKQMHQKQFRKQKMHNRGQQFKDLNLSETQKQAMKASREDFRKKNEALKNQPGITLKDYQAGKAQLEKERKEKMLSILTPEQKNRMDQQKKERKEQMEQRQQARMDRMTKDLSLTPDQVSKLKSQREATRQQMMALRNNDNLSTEQKKAESARIKKEAKQQREAILTKEQLEKLQNRRQHKPQKTIK